MHRRRGRLGKHRQRQFRRGHVVAQVVTLLQLLDLPVLVSGDRERPAMQNLGEDGELTPFLRATVAPLRRQFVADANALQALLDPLLVVATLVIEQPQRVRRHPWIVQFFQPLRAHARQLLLEQLGSGRGDALDDAQQRLGIRRIGQALFAIASGHLQHVTICNGLHRALFACQTQLQHMPVGAGVGALGQQSYHVNHAEEPPPPSSVRFLRTPQRLWYRCSAAAIRARNHAATRNHSLSGMSLYLPTWNASFNSP